MKIIYSVLFSFLFLASCDPCRYVDCIDDVYEINFRIIRSSDSVDLFFGTGKVYDFNKVKFFSLNGSDTIHYSLQPIYRDNDSCLHLELFPKSDIVYIKLDSLDVDTINLNYKYYQSKCCGNATQINQYTYNDSQIFSNSYTINIITK